MVRLVALDVDGTLTNSADQLTPKVRAAVRAASARGVGIVIATGRSLDGLVDVVDQLGVDPGVVTVNGAICSDGLDRTPYERNLLSINTTSTAVGWLLDNGFDPFVYDDPERSMSIAMGARRPAMPAFVAARERDHLHVDLLRWIDAPSLTVVCAGTRDEMKRAEAGLALELGESADCCASFYQTGRLWCLTVVDPRCTKDAAVARYAARHRVKLTDVMAIGDGDNDVALVANVGCGVAMGNACPAVLKAADHVVGTNDEDGVAQALQQFVLI